MIDATGRVGEDPVLQAGAGQLVSPLAVVPPRWRRPRQLKQSDIVVMLSLCTHQPVPVIPVLLFGDEEGHEGL